MSNFDTSVRRLSAALHATEEQRRTSATVALADAAERSAQRISDTHATVATGIHGVGSAYLAKTSRSDQWPAWGDIPDRPTLPLSPANGGTGTANTGNLAWASGGGTAALRNTGNAASGRLTYWTDDNTVGGDSTLRWNAGELIFGDQTNAPNYGNGNFHIAGSAGSFNIWDRSIGSTFPASPAAGQRWAWYAQSALLRLFTGSGDVFQIGSAGELNVMSYVEMQEITAPATPAANKARLFLRDNGGTTELCAIGASGTIHVIKALT